MSADLAVIVEAAKGRDGLVLSLHYLRDRLGSKDRPSIRELAFGLRDDAPKITRDEASAGSDARGEVCDISCETSDGRAIIVRVNYVKRPMKVVTAFYQQEAQE